MLGKLARWLRFFGYDCELAPEKSSDEDVIKLAEGRILLTRDKGLADLPDSLYVPFDDLEGQLRLVHENYTIKMEMSPNHCSLCNGKLVEAETISGRGWKCTKCGQEYWRGSHWEKINAFAKQVIENN